MEGRLTHMPTLRPTVMVLLALLVAVPACTATPDGNTAEEQNNQSVTSSSDADPSVNSDEDPGVERPAELPIAAAITEIAGYTEIDVLTAVTNARNDSIVTCMTAQGWEFGYADLPGVGSLTGPMLYFGTQIQYYLDEIDSAEVVSEGDPMNQETASADQFRDSVAFRQDEFDCMVRAENDFPNPLVPLWTWIAEETADLDTRVRQDNRSVVAREASETCFAASGYGFTTIGGASDHLHELGNQIWRRFTSGVITGDAARSELLQISEQVDELEGYALACDRELAAVEGEVRAEYEKAYLEANGDRIALLAADYAEQLTMYLEFLPRRADG